MERQTDAEETEKGRLKEDGEGLCETKRYRDRDTLIERHGEIRETEGGQKRWSEPRTHQIPLIGRQEASPETELRPGGP